jgi:acyl-CoA synthetase (AMP-forming)/AMP-acid ligase II
VYPAEVEAEILAVPGVIDAVVFGMPDARWGERVVALAVAHSGHPVTVGDIDRRLKDALAGYKRPRSLHLVESLERTPHGKVDLARLRERVRVLDEQESRAAAQ